MSRRLPALLAALLAVMAIAAVAVADPARKGSVDPGGAAYGWDGGPISGATTGNSVPCSPATQCDDTLVTASARGQMTVKISSDAMGSADLDLYVYESDAAGTKGKPVKSSAGPDATEMVTFEATAASYLVEVVAATALQGTYEGQASLAVLAPKSTAPDTTPDLGPDPAPGSPGTTTTSPTSGAITTPDDLAPSTKLKAPARSRTRTLSGTASDPDGTVAYVDVAIVHKAGRKCTALTAAGKLRAIKKCTAPSFLRAKGTKSWSLKLPEPLRPGHYTVFARSTDDQGRAEGGFGSDNRRAIVVR